MQHDFPKSLSEKDIPVFYWLLFEIYQSKQRKSRREIITNFCTHFDILTADAQKDRCLESLKTFGLIEYNPDYDSYATTIIGSKVVQEFFTKIHADYAEYVFLKRISNESANVSDTFPYLERIGGSYDLPLEEKYNPSLTLKIKTSLENIFDFLKYIDLLNRNFWQIPTIFDIIIQLTQIVK